MTLAVMIPTRIHVTRMIGSTGRSKMARMMLRKGF